MSHIFCNIFLFVIVSLRLSIYLSHISLSLSLLSGFVSVSHTHPITVQGVLVCAELWRLTGRQVHSDGLRGQEGHGVRGGVLRARMRLEETGQRFWGGFLGGRMGGRATSWPPKHSWSSLHQQLQHSLSQSSLPSSLIHHPASSPFRCDISYCGSSQMPPSSSPLPLLAQGWGMIA